MAMYSTGMPGFHFCVAETNVSHILILVAVVQFSFEQWSSGMNNHNNKSRDRVGTASSCSLKT